MQSNSTLKLIRDKTQRAITFYKRKRGLLKKAIEMAELCGVDVYMCVLDPRRQHIVELASNPNFKETAIANLKRMNDKMDNSAFFLEEFSRDDFSKLTCGNYSTRLDDSTKLLKKRVKKMDNLVEEARRASAQERPESLSLVKTDPCTQIGSSFGKSWAGPLSTQLVPTPLAEEVIFTKPRKISWNQLPALTFLAPTPVPTREIEVQSMTFDKPSPLEMELNAVDTFSILSCD